MKKSFMSNIKNFVDSNVRHRIDRVSHNNNEFFSDDLLLVERHFEDIRQVCVDAEKKISTLLQSIQANNSGSHSLGSYTQNMINQGSTTNSSIFIGNQIKSSSTSEADQKSQDRSSESLSNYGQRPPTQTSNQKVATTQQCASVDQQVVDQPFGRLSDDLQLRHKKLPTVGFLRFLTKTSNRLRSDSLLGMTLDHLTQLQNQLTMLYLDHEQMIENQCLKPIQHMLEIDIPNVIKMRKVFIKSHNDLESFKAKFNGASQKQVQYAQHIQHQSSGNSYTVTQNSAQQINANKLEQLKKELDEAMMRYEQSKDTYEAEIYGFVCRETELVSIILRFYHLKGQYHNQVGAIINGSLPTLHSALDCTPRKFAFGTTLNEHLRWTKRKVSPILELCVHLLFCQGIKEEGLFRIPGSSIKIKKLKHAINAWFVNLMDLRVSGDDRPGHTVDTCVVSLHDLFKNIIGKSSDRSSRPDSLTPEPDELDINHEQSDEDVLLDVHSIAGLLKLYLRELPEPLFTSALYEDWLNALNVPSTNVTTYADKSSGQQQRNEYRLNSLKEVVSRLPSSNYENLKHLFRFLNLLTKNQQYNKMTSTNLAIAIAPSLIWAKPVGQGRDQVSGNEEIPSATMSMSSFGISASLHAMLVDTLINNAETLFPGNVDFSLAEFKDLSLKQGHKYRRSKRADRPVKSTSPTGLSAASSSSFSSCASNTTSSNTAPNSAVKTHPRKSGSIDGLISEVGCSEIASICPASNQTETGRKSGTTIQRGQAFKSSRPVSVQVRREDYATLSTNHLSERVKAPPVPPILIARSHYVKQNQQLHGESPREQLVSYDNQVVKTKTLSRPLPLSDNLERQSQNVAETLSSPDNDCPREQQRSKPATAPRPVSLRGTGTISSAETSMTSPSTELTHNTNPNSIRPNVPPPERPAESEHKYQFVTGFIDPLECGAGKNSTQTNADMVSLASVTVHDVDETKSISPVVSLESLTADISSLPSGQSSFDEVDATSLESQQHNTVLDPALMEPNRALYHSVQKSNALIDDQFRADISRRESDESRVKNGSDASKNESQPNSSVFKERGLLCEAEHEVDLGARHVDYHPHQESIRSSATAGAKSSPHGQVSGSEPESQQTTIRKKLGHHVELSQPPARPPRSTSPKPATQSLAQHQQTIMSLEQRRQEKREREQEQQRQQSTLL